MYVYPALLITISLLDPGKLFSSKLMERGAPVAAGGGGGRRAANGSRLMTPSGRVQALIRCADAHPEHKPPKHAPAAAAAGTAGIPTHTHPLRRSLAMQLSARAQASFPTHPAPPCIASGSLLRTCAWPFQVLILSRNETMQLIQAADRAEPAAAARAVDDLLVLRPFVLLRL